MKERKRGHLVRRLLDSGGAREQSPPQAAKYCVIRDCGAIVGDSREWIDTCSTICDKAKRAGISRSQQEKINKLIRKKQIEIAATWTNKITT